MAALTTSLASLAACSFKQPPECDSPKVLNVLQSVVTENAQKSVMGQPAEDRAGQIKAPSAFFYRNVELAVSNVFDAGVRKDRNVRSCSAELHLNIPIGAARMAFAAQMMGAKVGDVDATSDGGVKAEIEYDVRLNDKGDQFEVESKSLTSMIDIVSFGHASVAGKLKWSGQWTGSYQCEPVASSQDLAFEGAVAPAPFKFSIDEYQSAGSDLRLERETAGGGAEKIHISFGPSTEAKVRIEGANTPRDRWQGQLWGSIRNDELKVTGKITTLNGSGLAKCSMHLEHTPLSEQKIAEALSKAE